MNSEIKKWTAAPRLSPDQAERQGRASTLAFLALGQAEAITFLNGYDDALGRRPIDLAVESAEGLASVEEAVILRKAANHPNSDEA